MPVNRRPYDLWAKQWCLQFLSLSTARNILFACVIMIDYSAGMAALL